MFHVSRDNSLTNYLISWLLWSVNRRPSQNWANMIMVEISDHLFDTKGLFQKHLNPEDSDSLLSEVTFISNSVFLQYRSCQSSFTVLDSKIEDNRKSQWSPRPAQFLCLQLIKPEATPSLTEIVKFSSFIFKALDWADLICTGSALQSWGGGQLKCHNLL